MSRNQAPTSSPVPAASPGASPGEARTIVSGRPPRVVVNHYSKTDLAQTEGGLERLDSLEPDTEQLWIDISGDLPAKALAALGQRLGLHPLHMEDATNIEHPASLQDEGRYLLITLPILKSGPPVERRQLSLFLFAEMVVTIHNGADAVLAPIFKRLASTSTTGRMRKSGSDYLAYAIVDSTLDHYFPVIESLDDRLLALEEEIVERPRESTMRALFQLKRDALRCSKIARPLRDALAELVRNQPELVRPETIPFLRDARDHAIHVIDNADTYRELANGAIDLYNSTVGNRMNEVMKVLTLFASIFMPMTFIAGLYGMNFSAEASPWNMPELTMRYGYFTALGVMAAVGLGMVWWFWRKGWLGRPPE